MILGIIILLLTAIAVIFIAFAFAVKCLQYGFDNKYQDDEQMFLDDCKLPPAPSKEDEVDLQ